MAQKSRMLARHDRSAKNRWLERTAQLAAHSAGSNSAKMLGGAPLGHSLPEFWSGCPFGQGLGRKRQGLPKLLHKTCRCRAPFDSLKLPLEARSPCSCIWLSQLFFVHLIAYGISLYQRRPSRPHRLIPTTPEFRKSCSATFHKGLALTIEERRVPHVLRVFWIEP